MTDEQEDMRSIAELAKEALAVQDACNLSGVVLSWGRAITRLRRLLPDAGTTTINTHPLNVLWADKCTQLAGRQFHDAYVWASKEVAENG